MSSIETTPLARPGQRLFEHLTNVGEMCYNYAKPYGLGNTAKLLGLFHDVGKYNPDWQKYLVESINNEKDDNDISSVKKVSHSVDGASAFCYFAEKYKFNIGFMWMFFNIISSHHGNLHDDIVRDNNGNYLHYKNSIKPIWFNSEKSSMIDNVILKDLPYLFEKSIVELSEFEKKNSGNLFSLSTVAKMLYSCLIDADRSDAGLICHTNKTNFQTLVSDINDYMSKFHPDSDINKVRQIIFNEAVKKGKELSCSSIYGIATPTGSGKTLSTLAFAMNHACNNNLDRIIYVVPYLSILDQTESIYTEIFENNNIVEDYSSSNEMKNVFTENWDKPIIMTTMVNILNTMASSKAFELRKLHNMGRSCIIFDEIQQIPIEWIGMFNMTVNELKNNYGSTILMSTATTPILNNEKFEKIRLDMDMCYNNIIHLTDEELNLFNSRCSYDLSMCDNPVTLDKVSDFIIDRMKSINSFLCVCNTKRESTDLYKKLCGRIGYCELLNTNKTKADRNEVIKRITDCTLKGKKIVCISTSMIEAGVDLSFDEGIRFCGGEDNVIQTAGRINRNGIGHTGKLYIVNLKSEGIDGDYKLPCQQVEEAKKAFISNRRNNKNLDVCSKDSLEKYYSIFFFGNGISTARKSDMLKRMKYEINNQKTTAINLLCNSCFGIKFLHERIMCGNLKNNDDNLISHLFQYNTVSENMHVIDDGISVFICNTEELKNTLKEFKTLHSILSSNYKDNKVISNAYSKMCKIMKIINEHSVSLRNESAKKLSGIECYEKCFYIDYDNEHYTKDIGFTL